MQHYLAEPDTTARNLAIVAHLAAYSGFFLPAIAPIVIPILILASRPDDPFVREHALESLNLEITLWGAIALSGLLSLVLIGIPFLLVALLFGMIAPISAAVAAASGHSHRYAFTIRFFH